MGAFISFWGQIISFWGHVFIGGTLSFLHWSCGDKVLLGVIINNWGHIITFWGRGFIGGDYHYLGARLLATWYQPPQRIALIVNSVQRTWTWPDLNSIQWIHFARICAQDGCSLWTSTASTSRAVQSITAPCHCCSVLGVAEAQRGQCPIVQSPQPPPPPPTTPTNPTQVAAQEEPE